MALSSRPDLAAGAFAQVLSAVRKPVLIPRLLKRKLVRRLRARTDREHELTINRLLLSAAAFLYLLISTHMGSESASAVLSKVEHWFAAYYAVAAALFLHLLLRPERSSARRLIGICIDFPIVSYLIHAGGSVTALFYPIYLWAIFGNGFRFGNRYLAVAAAVATLSFAAVIATTPYWQQNMPLAWGLLAGLVILPAYLSRLISRLSQAKKRAEAASRAKSLFLASVSHELRTPLNAIIGLSALLQEQDLSREQAGMVRTITSSGRSLLRLIDSILDLSRIDSGRMATAEAPFDLYALLGQVRSMLAVQAQEKGLRLAVHVTARTPQALSGDPSHLQQILVNLAGNAIKFTARGSVTISVDVVRREDASLRLRCEVNDTGIGIDPAAQTRIFETFTQADETIVDRFGGTGLGLAICKQLVELSGGEIGVESIPGAGSTFWFELDLRVAAEAAATEISEPVVVLSRDPELNAAITGLSARARSAASLDDLRAHVVSLAESGTSDVILVIDERAVGAAEAVRVADALMDGASQPPPMILVLDEEVSGFTPVSWRGRYASVVGRPLRQDQVAASLRIAVCSAGGVVDLWQPGAVDRVRRPCSVLVAEDNRTNQLVIGKILERAGHAVTLVDDGEAALDALSEGSFDVVLMDVNMPVLNGIDAAKFYRFAMLGQERVPIIALTADATPEARERCLHAGMDACATKPIEPRHLLDLIDSVLADDRVQSARPRAAAHPSPVPETAAEPGAPVNPRSLNAETLQQLEQLGGEEFLHQLVAQFVGDAAVVLRNLSRAVAEEDVQAFREQAHALRSCASNVGAQAIYDLCLSWRQISPRELALEGERHVRQLTAEFEAAQEKLQAYLAAASVDGREAGEARPLPRRSAS